MYVEELFLSLIFSFKTKPEEIHNIKGNLVYLKKVLRENGANIQKISWMYLELA